MKYSNGEDHETAPALSEAPAHLRLLADWFDMRDDNMGEPTEGRTVQRDLRYWADQMDRMFAKIDESIERTRARRAQARSESC